MDPLYCQIQWAGSMSHGIMPELEIKTTQAHLRICLKSCHEESLAVPLCGLLASVIVLEQ
jgi:hypothetical protein